MRRLLKQRLRLTAYMEIVVVVVLVIIGIFVVGSLDNARPVSSWSDDKLHRMYGKYLNAASANSGSPKASEYFSRSEKVKQEIESRRKRSAEQSIAKLADAMAPQIYAASQKTIEVIQRTATEIGIKMDQVHEIVGKRPTDSEKKFRTQGMSEDQAQAAALKDVFNISA